MALALRPISNSFQSAPRPEGRGDVGVSAPTTTRRSFQSAPRPEGRGDTLYRDNTRRDYLFQSAPRPEGRGDGGVLGALCCNTLTSPFREPLPSACSEPCHPRATAEREPTGCASIAGGSRCLSTP